MDMSQLIRLILAGGGGLAAASGADMFEPSTVGGDVGYQGEIPDYRAMRRTVPFDYDPNRRPGEAGRQYFTDQQFIDRDQEGYSAALQAAADQANTQAGELSASNKQHTQDIQPLLDSIYSGNNFAQGGPVGQYTDSTVDGLSDDIPAIINGEQPAALTGGEYVMPSDVVSGVGNGNSKAGAQRLAQFAEQVRKQRTGSGKQPEAVDFEQMIAGILGGNK